jgi:hypothetical protein
MREVNKEVVFGVPLRLGVFAQDFAFLHTF